MRSVPKAAAGRRLATLLVTVDVDALATEPLTREYVRDAVSIWRGLLPPA